MPKLGSSVFLQLEKEDCFVIHNNYAWPPPNPSPIANHENKLISASMGITNLLLSQTFTKIDFPRSWSLFIMGMAVLNSIFIARESGHRLMKIPERVSH